MKLVSALAGVLLLVGCTHPGSQTDPRKGLVYLEEDACDWASCSGYFKVCVGPDLQFGDFNREDKLGKLVRNSEECKR